jgi:electron transfer flavoprotein beta subunit
LFRIVVCIKEVVDTSLDLGYGRVEDTQIQKGLTYRANPQDWLALAEALRAKADLQDAEITLITCGPPRTEEYLREGLCLGAVRALRLPDDEFGLCLGFAKARALARAISLVGFDLVLTGAQSLDNGSGLTGPLIAAYLDLPCVVQVVSLGYNIAGNIALARKRSRGLQEELIVRPPAVLTIAASDAKLPYASVDSLLAAARAPVEVWSAADLGLTATELESDAAQKSARAPVRPRTRPAPLDSRLPAYYRIQALLEGGLTKRAGKVVKGDPEELADYLYELLTGIGGSSP